MSDLSKLSANGIARLKAKLELSRVAQTVYTGAKQLEQADNPVGRVIVDRLSAKALQRLDELAARQGRSRKAWPERFLNGPASRCDGKGEAARRIRSMTPPDIPQSDSVDLVRQIRSDFAARHVAQS